MIYMRSILESPSQTRKAVWVYLKQHWRMRLAPSSRGVTAEGLNLMVSWASPSISRGGSLLEIRFWHTILRNCCALDYRPSSKRRSTRVSETFCGSQMVPFGRYGRNLRSVLDDRQRPLRMMLASRDILLPQTKGKLDAH